jgi:hypothetical protein
VPSHIAAGKLDGTPKRPKRSTRFISSRRCCRSGITFTEPRTANGVTSDDPAERPGDLRMKANTRVVIIDAPDEETASNVAAHFQVMAFLIPDAPSPSADQPDRWRVNATVDASELG